MNDAFFAAHLALPQIGPRGQQAIARAHILLVGLGGIGGPAAMYLAAAGVGRLTLVDFDRVSESNLSRQLLFRRNDVGRQKTRVAAERLSEIAPELTLELVTERITSDRLQPLGGQATAWIDASDNVATRLACNEAALACGRPWVMASAIRFEGQLAIFQPGPDQPCYRCVYGDADEALEDCAGAGVFSVAAGIMGLAAAGQALQLVCANAVAGGLHLFDAASMTWKSLSTRRKSACPACGD